jgi:hypothetical protein
LAQAVAYERAGFSGEKGARTFDLDGLAFIHLTGKGAQARLAAECTVGRWVISNAHFDEDGPCLMIDAGFLKEAGAVAIYAKDEGLRIVSAKEQAGVRLWNAP